MLLANRLDIGSVGIKHVSIRSASASLRGNHKDESLADVPVEQLIEKAGAFAAVFPGWLRRVFFNP